MNINVIDTGFFDIITRKYSRFRNPRLKLPSLIFLFHPKSPILKNLLFKNVNILPGTRNYHINQHQPLHFVINLFLRLSSQFTASPAHIIFAGDTGEKIYRLSKMISPIQTPNLFYQSLNSQLFHAAISPPEKKEIYHHIRNRLKSHTQSLYLDSGLFYQTFLQDSKLSNLNMFHNLADRLITHPGTSESHESVSNTTPNDFKLFHERQNQESFFDTVTRRHLSNTFDHHKHMVSLSHHESTVSIVSTAITGRTGINKTTTDDAAPADPREFFPASTGAALHYFAPPVSAATAAREAAALSSAASPGIDPEVVTYPKDKTAAGKESHASHPPEVPKKPTVDLGHLTDQVYRMLERKLKVEKERRGW